LLPQANFLVTKIESFLVKAKAAQKNGFGTTLTLTSFLKGQQAAAKIAKFAASLCFFHILSRHID